MRTLIPIAMLLALLACDGSETIRLGADAEDDAVVTDVETDAEPDSSEADVDVGPADADADDTLLDPIDDLEDAHIRDDALADADVADTVTADSGTDAAPDTGDAASDMPDAGPPPEPLRILFIGNSFTFGGPVPDVVDVLANDAGWPDPDVQYSAFGGESLEGHRDRTSTVGLVDEGDWDVVVLQELSTRPTDNRGDPGQFKTDATWFYDRVQASSPGARVILYETWARHPDHSIYPIGFEDPAEMQAQLRFHYNAAADDYIPTHAEADTGTVEVAPAGDAWQEHLAEPGALRLHGDDDYHAGRNGQYLNGLVIYATIYDRATVGLTPWRVAPGDAVRLQASADATTGRTTPGGPAGTLPPVGLEVGDEVWVDFGDVPTGADGWIVIADAVDGAAFNVDSAGGESSSVDVAITDGFTGVNAQGLSDNAIGYPGEVSSDTVWTGSFDGHDAALATRGEVTVSGLDPGGRYAVRLFAARSGNDSGNGRLTRFTIGDAWQDLEVADNRSGLVTFEGLVPVDGGAMVIEVGISPEGASRFGYLGALQLERVE